MIKRRTIIFIIFVCYLSATANYAQPQAKRKQRLKTASATTTSSSATNSGTATAGMVGNERPGNTQITVQEVGGSGFPGVIPVWSTASSLGTSTITLNS